MITAELTHLQPRGFPALPKGWQTEVERFEDYSGKLHLFGLNYINLSKRSPRTLIIVHGQGEHIARYQHLPHFFDGVLSRIVGFDLRGHGRSQGTRGHVESFDEYAKDLLLFIKRWDQKLLTQFGKSEIHVLAHSMGGLIALRALLIEPQVPIASLSLSSPLLGLLNNVPAWKKPAAVILNSLAHKLQLSNSVDPNVLSHDPEVGRTYSLDRLVHNKVTPRFYYSLKQALKETPAAFQNKSEFRVPIQFLFPLEDKVVDVQASIKFAEQLKHKEKRVLIYEGLFHEILNETSKERVIEDIKSWIIEHSSSKS